MRPGRKPGCGRPWTPASRPSARASSKGGRRCPPSCPPTSTAAGGAAASGERMVSPRKKRAEEARSRRAGALAYALAGLEEKKTAGGDGGKNAEKEISDGS